MLQKHGFLAADMHNGSPDAVRTYLRYLTALSRLPSMHRSTQQTSASAVTHPISRLPGGESRNSCHCNDMNVNKEPLSSSDLPAPNRVNRPMCIIFNELDPIAALEESFELSAESSSNEIIFVQHKGVQTEDSPTIVYWRELENQPRRRRVIYLEPDADQDENEKNKIAQDKNNGTRTLYSEFKRPDEESINQTEDSKQPKEALEDSKRLNKTPENTVQNSKLQNIRPFGSVAPKDLKQSDDALEDSKRPKSTTENTAENSKNINVRSENPPEDSRQPNKTPENPVQNSKLQNIRPFGSVAPKDLKQSDDALEDSKRPKSTTENTAENSKNINVRSENPPEDSRQPQTTPEKPARNSKLLTYRSENKPEDPKQQNNLFAASQNLNRSFLNKKTVVPHQSYWKRSLLNFSTKKKRRSEEKPKTKVPETSEKEVQYEDEYADRNCSRMYYSMEKLEAHMENLQNDVNTLKTRSEKPITDDAQTNTEIKTDNILEVKPANRLKIEPEKIESKGYVILCKSRTDATQSDPGFTITRIPNGENTTGQPKQKIYVNGTDASTETNQNNAYTQTDQATSCIPQCKSQFDSKNIKVVRSPENPNPFNIQRLFVKNTVLTPSTNNNESQRDSQFTLIRDAKYNSNASKERPYVIVINKEYTSPEPFKPCNCSEKPTTNQGLERQPSSVCQFCSDKRQPVLNDLVSELAKLIGDRPYKSIMLFVLLRADNVYHVNVQMRESKMVIGCLLVNHAAIEKAIDQGIFKEILTYSVIDVRNTIRPIGRPFGMPFEFIARPQLNAQSDANDECAETSDSRVQEFITNVLRVPPDQIKKNVSYKLCP